MQPTVEELKELSASLPEEEIRGFLSAEEENDLISKIRQYDSKALENLLDAYHFVVVSVAKNYQDRGLDMDDLILAGKRGVIMATKSFDMSKDIRFISYAIWWIRASILNTEKHDDGTWFPTYSYICELCELAES